MDIDELRHDDGTPSAYEILEEFWPYDGPHSSHSMASAATAIAGLVRYLNNSTQYGVANAPTLWRIVAQVSTAADRFDQLLEQLERAARTLADDPTLRDAGRGEPPRAVALDLAEQMLTARKANRPLMHALDQASATSSRLGHRSEGGA